MLRKSSEMNTCDLDGCHGGVGLLQCTTVLGGGDSSRGIHFMHYDRIQPGASIGEHLHTNSEEVYYILSGEGDMIMDGEPTAVGPGDVSLVEDGHSHGIVNTGKSDLVIIVIGL